MLREKKYTQTIEWLESSVPFAKRYYFLAKAYSQQTENIFYAFRALFNEPVQDYAYWLLCHNLFVKINVRVDSLLEGSNEVCKKFLSMFKVCCDQLLSFNLSYDATEQFKNEARSLNYLLEEMLSNRKAKESFKLFTNSNESNVESILSKTRQWMIGTSRSKLQSNIRLILAKMLLLPSEENNKIVSVGEVLTSSQGKTPATEIMGPLLPVPVKLNANDQETPVFRI